MKYMNDGNFGMKLQTIRNSLQTTRDIKKLTAKDKRYSSKPYIYDGFGVVFKGYAGKLAMKQKRKTERISILKRKKSVETRNQHVSTKNQHASARVAKKIPHRVKPNGTLIASSHQNYFKHE